MCWAIPGAIRAVSERTASFMPALSTVLLSVSCFCLCEGFLLKHSGVLKVLRTWRNNKGPLRIRSALHSFIKELRVCRDSSEVPASSIQPLAVSIISRFRDNRISTHTFCSFRPFGINTAIIIRGNSHWNNGQIHLQNEFNFIQQTVTFSSFGC